MKIALCLFGAAGMKAGSSDRDRTSTTKDVLMSETTSKNKDNYICPSLSAQHYGHAIASRYDTDVFVHSWSDMFQSEILNSFNPKKHIIEPQRDFPVDLAKYGIAGDNIDEWNCSIPARAGYKHLVPSHSGARSAWVC